MCPSGDFLQFFLKVPTKCLYLVTYFCINSLSKTQFCGGRRRLTGAENLQRDPAFQAESHFAQGERSLDEADHVAASPRQSCPAPWVPQLSIKSTGLRPGRALSLYKRSRRTMTSFYVGA